MLCHGVCFILRFFFFKQKTAYEVRISDWSSDVCSSDLELPRHFHQALLEMPEHVRCYAIRGPLFFGAAEKALDVLRKFAPGVRVVAVEMSAVPMLDMTALAAFDSILKDYRKTGRASCRERVSQYV